MPPHPAQPAGEPTKPEGERSGTDWTRREDGSPNPHPQDFPGGNQPLEDHPEKPGMPGIDPNPSRPGAPEPRPGGEDPGFPEGPDPQPDRYPHPQRPQDLYDRPPVGPQGGGESGAGPGADPTEPQALPGD